MRLRTSLSSFGSSIASRSPTYWRSGHAVKVKRLALKSMVLYPLPFALEDVLIHSKTTTTEASTTTTGKSVEALETEHVEHNFDDNCRTLGWIVVNETSIRTAILDTRPSPLEEAW